MCEYLAGRIELLASAASLYDVGLWSWLSVFYFTQVCPGHVTGQVKDNDWYYILDREWNHYYRHLIAGPVRMYLWHRPEIPRIIFNEPVHVHGDFMEQLASSQEVAPCRGVIGAADRLYWDETAGDAKRGARDTAHKPGTLRRFTDVVKQLDLTYDLHTVTADEFVSLLPAEFTPWIRQAELAQ
jgi:hypothetical protein